MGGVFIQQEYYLKILDFLNDHYKKDPLYYVPSSTMRSKLGMSVEELRSYAENLELNRYVYKMEGEANTNTFLLKIRHKGMDAIKSGKVPIEQACKYHTPEKLRMLEVLRREHEEGNPYYTPGKEVMELAHIKESEIHDIADELEFCGWARKVETEYPHFTLQITNAGLEYLHRNENFFSEESTHKIRHPKFEMYRDNAGNYRFRLKAPNGEEIAASQPYKTKAACLNGIDSVKKNALVAETIELEH